jgi:hypothetical protein
MTPVLAGDEVTSSAKILGIFWAWAWNCESEVKITP